MVEVCMVPLCSLSQHKATVYLTCPHQCSACKLRTPQQAMGHPSNTWDQLHPSLFLWRSSSRPWSTQWHYSVLTEHKAMDSWKLGLQWKPFWSKHFRPTNCSGDLEELGSIHLDSASTWKREGWYNKLPQKDSVWSFNNEQTRTGSQWKTLPAPSYPKHNSTLLNSTNHIWYAIHSKKRSGFSVALKLQCLYPSAPPFHTVPDLPVSAVLSLSVVPFWTGLWAPLSVSVSVAGLAQGSTAALSNRMMKQCSRPVSTALYHCEWEPCCAGHGSGNCWLSNVPPRGLQFTTDVYYTG